MFSSCQCLVKCDMRSPTRLTDQPLSLTLSSVPLSLRSRFLREINRSPNLSALLGHDSTRSPRRLLTPLRRSTNSPLPSRASPLPRNRPKLDLDDAQDEPQTPSPTTYRIHRGISEQENEHLIELSRPRRTTCSVASGSHLNPITNPTEKLLLIPWLLSAWNRRR